MSHKTVCAHNCTSTDMSASANMGAMLDYRTAAHCGTVVDYGPI